MAADASEEDAERDVPTVQVVEFTVAGEQFAVDVMAVDSIEELGDITRVPRTNEAIAGVMDLRGEITAVIDPRVHLEVDPSRSLPAGAQVLVLDQSFDKQKLGLRVDRVDGVEEYPETDVVEHAEFEELDTVGVRERAIRSVIQKPSADSEFEPLGLIDVNELVERTRRME